MTTHRDISDVDEDGTDIIDTSEKDGGRGEEKHEQKKNYKQHKKMKTI